MITSSTLVVPSVLLLTKPFQINLNQSNKVEIVVLETTQLVILMMNCSAHIVIPLQQTSPRLMTPPRPLGNPTSQLNCFSNKSKMPKSLPSVQILDMIYHVLSCMHWITSQIQVFLRRTPSLLLLTYNITLTILIDPHSRKFGPLLGKNNNITSVLQEVQHMPIYQHCNKW